MTPAAETPHPAEQSKLEIVSLANQEQYDANNNYEVRIFTDGSKLGGKVGAALSIWNSTSETKTQKLALPSYSTVYQAELLALCKATGEIIRHKAKSFGVYSDSMAALQTVKNSQCLHPLAVEARENLRTSYLQGKAVHLHWIKAHAGLEGNERADQLAKEAAENSKRKPDYELCPVSFVKRSIRRDTLDEWNKRYATGDTASGTKLFFPNAITAYRTVRKMEATNIKTQLMTGHGGFAEYLNRFKCKESP
ncbi:ribonuclease H-like [Cydia splendana]|uniref:ribonuclease H-like n=1 Tax=Cydia splendana TaxID=1100963 RepID=UPI00300C3725